MQDGGLVVLVGMTRYPGKPLGPSCLVLLRLYSVDTFIQDGGYFEGESRSWWYKRYGTVYPYSPKVSVKHEIDHNPPRERLLLEEQPYELESGRVFLIDLTAQPEEGNLYNPRPPKIIPIKADLAGLFPRQGGEPTPEEMKQAVDKLREKNPEIRDFVVEKKADE
jgi:hypothetical protein